MCSNSEVTGPSPSETAVTRYQALLEMADTLGHQGALPQLLNELGVRLKNIVIFDFINFSLYDEVNNNMRLSFWEGTVRPALPMQLNLNESVAGWVWQNQKPFVWSEVEHGSQYRTISEMLHSRGMQSYCSLPLSTPQRRLGAVGFGTAR